MTFHIHFSSIKQTSNSHTLLHLHLSSQPSLTITMGRNNNNNVQLSQDPPIKTHNLYYKAQICLRLSSIAASLTSCIIIFASSATAVLFGTTFQAKYSYSPSLKFFAFANTVATVSVLISLVFFVAICSKGYNPMHYFCLFIHDLVVMTLVMAGSAGATAVGMIAKYGDEHSGWSGICGYFSNYCKKTEMSMMFSYISFMCLMSLAIWNERRPRLLLP